MSLKRFNIRVYGIVRQGDKVLLTDEVRLGKEMTKFPGGGLEFGEGLEDGLKREFKEEMGLGVEVGDLFHINKELVISSFNSEEQLLSIYYFVQPIGKLKGLVKKPFDMAKDESQCFRWRPIIELSKDEMTFPIDKEVVEKLKTII